MTPPRLHILGCGRTARAIARRLHRADAVAIGQIVNRSLASARDAAAFVGSGCPASELSGLGSADWLMIGVPDGLIEEIVGRLIESDQGAPALIFHLSGSVPAAVLAPVAPGHAAVHPLRAFSEPGRAVERFKGTWCVAEGSALARAALRPAFEAAGARWIEFEARNKPAWHAATMAASNFLVTVNALARELAETAGMEADDARRLLADLMRGTLAELGERPAAAEALTGPLERGDEAACRRIRQALDEAVGGSTAALFSELARATLDLARDKRGCRAGDAEIEELFCGPLTSRRD